MSSPGAPPTDSEVRGLAVPRARGSGEALAVRPPAVVAALARSAAPRLIETITAQVRSEVVALGGPRRRLHALVRETVTIAINTFFALAAGDVAALADVDHHFHALGRLAASATPRIGALLEAIRIAGGSVWETIRIATVRSELSGLVVAELGVSVSAFLRRLASDVEQGFQEERRRLVDARGALTSALLGDSPLSELSEAASAAGWSLPAWTVVSAVRLHGIVPPRELRIPADALLRYDGDRLVVVSTPDGLAQTRIALLRLGPQIVVAESWPVAPIRTGDAYRWTRRALSMVAAGRLHAEARVLACAQHRMALMLEADPPLMQSVAGEVLAPLLAESPHQRIVLGETLLLWLQVNESAPVLAKRLGCHPQTVRNRVRRLRAMFGDSLDGPEQRMALILALGARLPRWRLGIVP